MRRLAASILAAVVLLATCPGGAAPAAEEDEAVVGRLPWEPGPTTLFLRRLVDASTGRPATGANVRLYAEVPHPVPGFRRPSAEASSDADGWVRIDASALDPALTATYGRPAWAFAEAPGLGPEAVYDAFLQPDPDWEIPPAAPLRFDLFDPLDRPIEGVEVGWFLGCGHTPDVRTARTGADGAAVFPAVAQATRREAFGRGWSVAPGLRSRYLDPDDGYAPWQRPRTTRLAWGFDVEGTVLRPDGTPAAGVAVGAPALHRGPWAITGADGRFRLVGTEYAAGDDLLVEDGEYAVGPGDVAKNVRASSFDAPPRGRSVVFRIPAGGEVDERDAVVPLRVQIDRPGWPTLRAEPGVEVVAVRLLDGWTTRARAEGDAVALDVRPGEYEVRVLGRRGSDRNSVTYARSRARVLVGATGASPRVTLPPPALLALQTDAPGLSVSLVTEGEEEPLAELEGAGQDVLVPVDRPLFLRIETEGHARSRLLRVPAALLVAGQRSRTWTVPGFHRVEVRARFVDPAGRPVGGYLSEPEATEPPDGPASATPTLSTLSGENVRLTAWPADPARLQPRIVEVGTIAAGAVTADLGTVVLPPRSPSLTVLAADGRPLADASIRATRGTRSEEMLAGSASLAGVVFDPWDAPGLLVEGTLVRVLENAGAPVVRRLVGPGPWRVTLGGGSLRVEPRTESGEGPVRFTVALDGRVQDVHDNAVLLPGLDPGPHEAIVAAPGATPRRLRFTLSEGQSMHFWQPRLRRAP